MAPAEKKVPERPEDILLVEILKSMLTCASPRSPGKNNEKPAARGEAEAEAGGDGVEARAPEARRHVCACGWILRNSDGVNYRPLADALPAPRSHRPEGLGAEPCAQRRHLNVQLLQPPLDRRLVPPRRRVPPAAGRQPRVLGVQPVLLLREAHELALERREARHRPPLQIVVHRERHAAVAVV